ncbi:MAG: hypothetical protein ACSLFF_07975 [Solirubrobacterales bacterium]
MTFSKRVAASSAAADSQDAARAAAPEVPLGSNGQVSVYGKCYLFLTQVYVELLEKSSADGALSALYGNGYLDTSTPEGDRLMRGAFAANNDS